MTSRTVMTVLLAVVVAAMPAVGEASVARTLRVGYIPIAECAHLYIAIQNHYFSDAGLAVEIRPMKGGAAILPELERGELDFGFSNVVSMIAYNANRPARSPTRLVSLAGASFERPKNNNHGLMALASSKVRIEDMGRGAPVALNTGGNVEELMLLRFLQKKNVALVQFAPIYMGFPEMLTALDQGRVQVASLVEPFLAQGLRSGKYRLLARQYEEVDPNALVATYAVTAQWAAENREVVKTLRQVFRRANDFLLERNAESRQIIAVHTKIPTEDANVMGMPAYEVCLEKGGVQALLEPMQHLGFLRADRGQRIPDPGELLLGCAEDVKSR